MNFRRCADEKLKSIRGLSRLELLCIIFISVVALCLIIVGARWVVVQQLKGDDAMLENNAFDTATLNTVGNSSCPVNGCPGGECEHHEAEGWVGYFNHPTNRIDGKPMAGYNEYSKMEIDGVTYKGSAGTMIIKVVVDDNGEIHLSWVRGK